MGSPPFFGHPMYSDEPIRIGSMLNEHILKELDRMWPNVMPHHADPDLRIKAAQREVINILWQHFLNSNSHSPDKDIL